MNDVTIYHELEQRTPEWYAARAGLVTASTVGKLLTPTLKIADNDTSRGLLTTLAAERITGQVEETPITRDMERGIIAEDFARDAYEQHNSLTVQQVGFIVRHFDGYDLGYSPDGIVGEDGLLEIKAPRAKGHVQTILADDVPAYYMAQVQTALLVTGRDWIDYVSFNGGMPLYTKRVTPDPRWHDAIRDAVYVAEAQITTITERYQAAVAGLPMTERIPDPYAEPELTL